MTAKRIFATLLLLIALFMTVGVRFDQIELAEIWNLQVDRQAASSRTHGGNIAEGKISTPAFGSENRRRP